MRLVIDFDNTICQTGEWIDINTFGDPYPGVREALTRLRNEGWHVLIHSCRWACEASHEDTRHLELTPAEKTRSMNNVRMWLYEHRIPFDGLWEADKPGATYYIDDKAIAFKGDWSEITNKILSTEEFSL